MMKRHNSKRTENNHWKGKSAYESNLGLILLIFFGELDIDDQIVLPT